MRALQHLEIFGVPSDEKRRCRQELEIGGAERIDAMGSRQNLIGIGPCPLVVVLTAPFEIARMVPSAVGGGSSREFAHLSSGLTKASSDSSNMAEALPVGQKSERSVTSPKAVTNAR